MLGHPTSRDELLQTLRQLEEYYYGPFGPWHPRFLDFMNSAPGSDAEKWVENRPDEAAKMMREWIQSASHETIAFVIECIASYPIEKDAECGMIIYDFVEGCFHDRPESVESLFMLYLDSTRTDLTPLITAVLDFSEETAYSPAIPYMKRMSQYLQGDAKQYVSDRLRGLSKRAMMDQ